MARRSDGDTIEWQASNVLSISNWFHVAVTYDATNMTISDPEIYVNGVSKSVSLIGGSKTLAGYGGIAGNDCFIGNRDEFFSFPVNYFHNRAFAGKMSDVAIWNRMLSQLEIETIYNNGVARGLSPIFNDFRENIQLWYEMGEGFDTRAFFTDDSDSGKHSTDTDEIDFSNFIDETKPSFHKVHRNTSYRLHPDAESTTSEPSLEKTHNNAFFSTPIPASDFQYSWIESTLSKEYSIDSGRQNHFRYSPIDGVLSSSSGIVEAIIFPSSSNIT